MPLLVFECMEWRRRTAQFSSSFVSEDCGRVWDKLHIKSWSGLEMMSHPQWGFKCVTVFCSFHCSLKSHINRFGMSESVKIALSCCEHSMRFTDEDYHL